MTISRRTSISHLSIPRKLNEDVDSEEGMMKPAFRIEL
jgi:hypothetical protein